jgi:spermidine synthase
MTRSLLHLNRIRAITLLCGLFSGLLILVPARGEIIYQTKSEFNTIIVEEDREGVRVLLFEEGGAIQSKYDPKRPNELMLNYAKVAMSALTIVPQPKRILVVGLGGGGMSTFLRHHFPDAQIDNAELDPVVVDVARRFFGFREDPRMKVHIGDGRRFIEQTDNRYDIIFMDAYGADSIPYSLATVEFIRALRSRLADDGVVMANIWGPSSNRLYYSMLRTYREVFEGQHVIDSPTSDNRIVLSTPRQTNMTRDAMVARAREIQTEKKFSFDLAALIESGYRMPAPLPPDARVLHDADPPAP